MNYKQIAYKYLPLETRVEIIPKDGIRIDDEQIIDGYAYSDKFGIKICVPEVKTKKDFLIFIHECGHVKLGHLSSPILGTSKAYHLDEEADDYVQQICNKENIPITKIDKMHFTQTSDNAKNPKIYKMQQRIAEKEFKTRQKEYNE